MNARTPAAPTSAPATMPSGNLCYTGSFPKTPFPRNHGFCSRLAGPTIPPRRTAFVPDRGPDRPANSSAGSFICTSMADRSNAGAAPECAATRFGHDQGVGAGHRRRLLQVERFDFRTRCRCCRPSPDCKLHNRRPKKLARYRWNWLPVAPRRFRQRLRQPVRLGGRNAPARTWHCNGGSADIRR